MATCVFDYCAIPGGWPDRPAMRARDLPAAAPLTMTLHARLRPRARHVRARLAHGNQTFAETGVKTSGLPRPITHGRHQ